MSSTSEQSAPEPEFDLEKLFLPAWAQGSASVNKYAGFSGEDRGPRDRNRGDSFGGGRRPPRRDGDRSGDRNAGPGGQRSPQGAGNRGRNDRGPRRDGPRSDGPRDRQDLPYAQREAPAPLPQITISILPDEKGVESLARQIRITGRAYPLFDIARLILQKPERQQVRFDVIKKEDGQPIQPLFLCALDDSLWLSEAEAIQHLLAKHFDTFYQAEKTQTDPPKGTYTFVAQCGMSGAVLGPPNHHDYQNQLRKLHAERFARMPFESFKNRVKIVKDEAVVKKWIEDQSTKTEYNPLNVSEAQKLPNREEVEKHFRSVHAGNLVKMVESHTMSGPAARQLRSPELQRFLRIMWDEQRRFPLKVATVLSQQFASHGLQFFKVNRTVTHVSVARPRYLDLEATPVSEGVKRIVEFVGKNPGCNRRKLVQTLAPSSSPVTPAPAPAPAAVPAATDGETPPAATTVALPEASPEQTALAGDLHWLIHEGHVIEFANGNLETAKKPLPRPPKPAKAPAAPAAPVPNGASPAVEGSPEDSLAAADMAAMATIESVPALAADENSSGVEVSADASDTPPAEETVALTATEPPAESHGAS